MCGDPLRPYDPVIEKRPKKDKNMIMKTKKRATTLSFSAGTPRQSEADAKAHAKAMPAATA